MLDNNEPYFDELTFEEFVKERNKAVMADKRTFIFDNKEIQVAFADFIINTIAEQNPRINVTTHYISKN